MNPDKTSLWRIPAMWLVIGLPLLSIVAGVGLVVVASRTGNTDVVPDQVQRVSQIQTTDLGPDAQAARRGLSAIVRADETGIEVIPVSGDFDRQQPLRLVLQHPTSASQDLQVALASSDNGWRGELEVDASHDWVLQLDDGQGQWRLQGRLSRGQQAARLAPSLQP